MKVLNLTLRKKRGLQPLSFTVKRMVNAGYVGRDQESVRRHIEELKKEGVPAPDETPSIYPKPPYLITTDDVVEVVDEFTSGEAEFVLFLDKGEMYVGVGSDHTDRKLEASNILKSKQLCPNVVSSVVWSYDEVKKEWDSLILRSWVEKEGTKTLYQEAKLSAIMTIDALIAFVKGKLKDSDMDGLVIYSGTVAALGGETIYGDSFEVELHNPQTKDSLRCRYDVRLLGYLK